MDGLDGWFEQIFFLKTSKGNIAEERSQRYLKIRRGKAIRSFNV